LDLAYPHHKIAVEYDGYDFHLRTEEQREADRERRKWLRDNGWYVIVLTKSSFNTYALSAWLRNLRGELDARRPARLARH
jgi:very-short-patch-repair endonuclease